MNQPINKSLASAIWTAAWAISLAIIFVLLGIWQLDRAAALKASLVVATTIDPRTVLLESVAAANTSLAPEAVNRMVSFTGRYVGQYRAPGQVNATGQIEDWEVSLVQVGNNGGILLVRGLWSQRQYHSEITASMPIEITGQLLAHQDGDHAENAPGVISRLDSAVIVGNSELDLFDGYVLARSEKLNSVDLVRTRVSAEKLVSRIPGFYWQHLSYVVIWWLMAAVVLYLPFYRRKVGT